MGQGLVSPVSPREPKRHGDTEPWISIMRMRSKRKKKIESKRQAFATEFELAIPISVVVAKCQVL